MNLLLARRNFRQRIKMSFQTGLQWLTPLLFLLVFFFYPLASIFGIVGRTLLEQGLGSSGLVRAGRALSFTVWQAGLSTLLTLLVGLPAAAVFGRFTFPGKRLLRVLTTLPFILPTVVVAAGFNALLGPHGWINVALVGWLRLDQPPVQILNTLPAILLAHVFYNTTIVIRVVGSAWSQLDPRLEQAARILGASSRRTLWEITLPLLRPAILAAALLVFLFDFTSFGVILLLGGPQYATLEVEIYTQAMQMLNLPLAGLLSLIQMFCTLLITAIYSRANQQVGSVPLAPRLKGEGMHQPASWRSRLFVGGVVIVLLVLLVSPLAALALRSVTVLNGDIENRQALNTGVTLDYYHALFTNQRQSLFYVPPAAAVRNSLLYAGATVVISLSMGMLAAYALNRPGRAARWLDVFLMLPLGASAVTLGLGYLVAFNHPPLDARSFPILIPLAHSLVALPFVVRAIQPALAAIPPRLRQAATALGASPRRVWWEVDLPIIARAVMVGAIFSFTISLGEFGATSFLARPEYPTMPVAIYRFLSQPGALNYGQALAMATLLMTVCGLGIVLIERMEA